MKRLIKRAALRIAKTLKQLGVGPDKIIIHMDGGICSQIHFYLVGQYLSRRGNRVVFDIDWFELCGMDTNGVHPRNFELTRMFPTLEFKACSRRSITKAIYRKLFARYYDYFDSANAMEWTESQAPLYIDGYFRDIDDLYSAEALKALRVDDSIFDSDNREMLQKIATARAEGGACAIHVRRGDLSVSHDAYGAPSTPEYFTSAIKAVIKESPDCRFFLFSDEPQWCRDELLPALGMEQNIKDRITISSVNGPDRAYCDLALMSFFPHQITSQGSMGKYAAMLRPDELAYGIVVLPPNEESKPWLRRIPNASVARFEQYIFQ